MKESIQIHEKDLDNMRYVQRKAEGNLKTIKAGIDFRKIEINRYKNQIAEAKRQGIASFDKNRFLSEEE